MKLSHFKLSTRIAAGFGSVLLLLVIVAVFGYVGLRQSLDGLTDYRDLARDNIKIAALNAQLLAVRLDVKEYFVTKSNETIQKYEGTKAQMLQLLDDAKKEISNPKRAEQLRLFETRFGEYDRDVRQLMAALLQTNNQARVTELQDGLVRIGVDMASATKGITDSITDEQIKLGTTFQSNVQRSVMIIAIVSAAAIVIGVLVTIFLTLGITRPLQVIIDDLGAGADQTSSASAQVSSASQALAEGASEQAASLEETSSSLEEMSSMTKRNADNAGKANDLAREARSAADHGASDMQAMAQAMQDIKVSSDDIAKIIKTIDEIAFQTNILALNAAVEAARAGEAGMGFAVVADEVRNLAQRSAQAAKETAGKIEGAIEKTSQGVEISDKVLKSLKDIVDRVRKVDELVAEVAAASKEQSQGIEQVNLAVGQMDKVTQSNAASAEETASASEELSAQASSLKDTVVQMEQLVHGDSYQAAHGGAASSSRPPVTVSRAPAPAAPAAPAEGNGKLSRAVTPARVISTVRPAAAGRAGASEPAEGTFRDF